MSSLRNRQVTTCLHPSSHSRSYQQRCDVVPRQRRQLFNFYDCNRNRGRAKLALSCWD